MPKIIKVRCNGPNKHVNEIDLDKALGTTLVLRTIVLSGSPGTIERPIPPRVVRPCHFCTEGKVIITRQMIVENL